MEMFLFIEKNYVLCIILFGRQKSSIIYFLKAVFHHKVKYILVNKGLPLVILKICILVKVMCSFWLYADL